MILLSLREVRNKQSLLVPALKQNIEHWQVLQLNLFGYVGYYRIFVLTVPLQLNFTMIIEVLFKLLIMMSSMNVLNILRSIVTSFVIICFRVRTLQSVSSQYQLADIFTKPLPPKTFRGLASKLIMVSLKPP